MRTRGYIRESTARQGERYGPDAQRTTIERACRELGLPKADRWYTDLVSGTGKVVRDELATARRAAAAGEYDVLVCYDTSRWARNERDAFAFEDEMHRAGVRIYYAAERIWSNDEAEGAAIAKGMFHVLNAQYSRSLKRKITDGYKAKFATLGLPGGQLPWGYRWGAEAKSVELDEEAAAVRRLVFELYGTGEYSSRSLADELNRRGVRIAGRPFNGSTSFEILRNPIAIGTTRRGSETHEGAVPAIVDRELWDRCQRILSERRAWQGAARRNVFVFSSRARHVPCGRALWGWRKPIRGKSERRLAHSSPSCSVPFQRNEEILERIFAMWLDTFELDARRRIQLAAFLRDDGDLGEDLEGERRRAEQRLERAKKLFLLGDLEEKAFLAERRASQAVLEASPRTRDVRVKDAIALHTLAAAWPKASLEARRAFIEELVTEIRFDSDTIELVIRPELRRMVAALASPAIAVEISQERDERGRWNQEGATLKVVDVGKAVATAAKTTEGLTCGDAGFRSARQHTARRPGNRGPPQGVGAPQRISPPSAHTGND
jgi:DNA invertase Pin-like site-specific DNA recombinase